MIKFEVFASLIFSSARIIHNLIESLSVCQSNGFSGELEPLDLLLIKGFMYFSEKISVTVLYCRLFLRKQ